MNILMVVDLMSDDQNYMVFWTDTSSEDLKVSIDKVNVEEFNEYLIAKFDGSKLNVYTIFTPDLDLSENIYIEEFCSVNTKLKRYAKRGFKVTKLLKLVDDTIQDDHKPMIKIYGLTLLALDQRRGNNNVDIQKILDSGKSNNNYKIDF